MLTEKQKDLALTLSWPTCILADIHKKVSAE